MLYHVLSICTIMSFRTLKDRKRHFDQSSRVDPACTKNGYLVYVVHALNQITKHDAWFQWDEAPANQQLDHWDTLGKI